LSSIQEIGEKLLSNLTKAEADGQTAMTPALAFCLGMASKWRHDLNQMYHFPLTLESSWPMDCPMSVSVKPKNLNTS